MARNRKAVKWFGWLGQGPRSSEGMVILKPYPPGMTRVKQSNCLAALQEIRVAAQFEVKGQIV